MSKALKFFSKNKKNLFFVIGLGVILFFLPGQFIEAVPTVDLPPELGGGHYDLCENCSANPLSWYWCIVCFVSYIVSLPVRIMFAAIVILFGVGALIAGIFYAIVAFVVTWLIGVIMSVGIVPGGPNTPDIVSIGWNFSRQFANLFFILALAFIGLSTILRIKEYEAKKALPTLIIIALLINFTPVIVGFVVDMGNIVTKFFLDSAGSINGMLNIIESAWNYIVRSMVHIFLRDGQWWENIIGILGEFIGIAIYGLVLFIFFNVAMFIYLLIGAVFFCRTIILWILMIISPIAFLSKVFPATRTTKMIFPDILHWDKWWQSLIQWTIIGIPIGFFLYLSNEIMAPGSEASIQGIFNSANLETGLGNLSNYASSTFSVALGDQFISLFTSLLAPTVGLAFLVMGMLISFKAVPEGAKGIMQFATEKGVRRGWQGIRAGYASMGRAPQTYRMAKLRMGGGQAIRHTIRHTLSDTGRQMRDAWWKRQSPLPTPPDGGAPTAPAAATTGAPSSTTAKAKIIIPTSATPGEHEEKLTGEERLERRQRLARGEEVEPLPSPPAGGRRARAAALGAVKWVFPTPKRLLKRQERAFKFGGRVAASILKSTESIAKQEIDRRMKIDKESKRKKTKKTINCPLCLKEIPSDSIVCPYCKEELE